MALLTAMIVMAGLAVISCEKAGEPPLLPETPVMAVVDTLHGIEIVDNYRWLENGEDSQVIAWADQQDKYCRYFLHNYPWKYSVRIMVIACRASERNIFPGRRLLL